MLGLVLRDQQAGLQDRHGLVRVSILSRVAAPAVKAARHSHLADDGRLGDDRVVRLLHHIASAFDDEKAEGHKGDCELDHGARGGAKKDLQTGPQHGSRPAWLRSSRSGRLRAATTPSSWSRCRQRSTGGSRAGGVFDLAIVEKLPGYIVLEASGKGVDEAFRNEAGGHRWQRVPPTEKRGRVQTSTITVAVLPELTDAQIRIDPRDVEIVPTRGSGPGGQNRNKVETAIQLRHRPSGLLIRVETERSQHQNRATAMHMLRAKLLEAEQDRVTGDRAAARKAQVGSGMRGDKRRTIRVQDGQVNDHVTGKTWQYKNYERGNW